VDRRVVVEWRAGVGRRPVMVQWMSYRTALTLPLRQL
jgi:hypothetical protein